MSYSKYPSQIDSSLELPPTTDNVTPVKAEIVNRLRDAILAIENELGIDPSREFGTVRDRLDSLIGQLDNDIEEILSFGFFKAPCDAVNRNPIGASYIAHNNILTSTVNGILSPSLTKGMSLLLAGEVAPNDMYNGIYIITDLGSASTPFILTRRYDSNTSSKLMYGTTVMALQPSSQNFVWILTTSNPINLNVTPLQFSCIRLDSLIQGDGITINKSSFATTISANIDNSSIIVNSAALTVGTISDSQHGNRGNGTLHTVVNSGSAGFMSNTDKVKLDGIDTGAQKTDFTHVQSALSSGFTVIDFNARLVSNIATPSIGQDTAATPKAYVDSHIGYSILTLSYTAINAACIGGQTVQFFNFSGLCPVGAIALGGTYQINNAFSAPSATLIKMSSGIPSSYHIFNNIPIDSSGILATPVASFGNADYMASISLASFVCKIEISGPTDLTQLTAGNISLQCMYVVPKLT